MRNAFVVAKGDAPSFTAAKRHPVATTCLSAGARLWSPATGVYACGPQMWKNPGMTEQETSANRRPIPKALRKRLRAAAVAKVRQDIIHAGRRESDYAPEDLEYLVAEKEKEIWSGIGWKGFGIVALLLGINIGI